MAPLSYLGRKLKQGGSSSGSADPGDPGDSIGDPRVVEDSFCCRGELGLAETALARSLTQIASSFTCCSSLDTLFDSACSCWTRSWTLWRRFSRHRRAESRFCFFLISARSAGDEISRTELMEVSLALCSSAAFAEALFVCLMRADLSSGMLTDTDAFSARGTSAAGQSALNKRLLPLHTRVLGRSAATALIRAVECGRGVTGVRQCGRGVTAGGQCG